MENPFGIAFTLLKMKYAVYDASITSLGVLQPSDKVNVFLNVETILKYLTTISDLDEKLILHGEFKKTMVSDLVNVAGHYKDFFKGNGLNTKVFLYMTDLTSEEDSFKECKYNVDYRSYYCNKYRGNPKYSRLTDAWITTILPKVRTICDFVPDVYFVTAKNMEGSLIPGIVGEVYPDRKNFIISSDNYETQYQFLPNFVHHLYKRHFGNTSIACTLKEYLQVITKEDSITEEDIELYKNPTFYLLLLTCYGDAYRSISKVQGTGFKTLTKILKTGIYQGKITADTRSLELICDALLKDISYSFVKNDMMAMSLENRLQDLTEGEKKMITSQIEDRSDINSLMKLNQEVFQGCELRLESLLC